MSKKLKIFHCVQDAGDGSYHTRFFRSQQEMDKWREKEEEINGYAVDTDCCCIVVTESNDGKLQSDVRYTEVDED